MITLTATVEINGKEPDQIYDWILNMDNEKYKQWHPAHIKWKTIKRTPNEIGSIVYMAEKFHRFTLRLTGELVELKSNRLLLYKIIKSPISGYLSLAFDPIKEGTKVTHVVRVGYGGRLGGFLDWLLRKVVFTQSFERSLEAHAGEEFKNLEELL